MVIIDTHNNFYLHINNQVLKIEVDLCFFLYLIEILLDILERAILDRMTNLCWISFIITHDIEKSIQVSVHNANQV